jgi:hypothetical protein
LFSGWYTKEKPCCVSVKLSLYRETREGGANGTGHHVLDLGIFVRKIEDKVAIPDTTFLVRLDNLFLLIFALRM